MSEETRNALLAALGTELLNVIRNGVLVPDSDGRLVKQPAPASYMSVAERLLKDFPPQELPTKQHPVGQLKEFMDSGRKLPYAPA